MRVKPEHHEPIDHPARHPYPDPIISGGIVIAKKDSKRRKKKKPVNTGNRNEPVKPPWPIIIDPNKFPVVDPRTDKDFEHIVEDVCRYIERSRHRHGSRFAMKVGTYLYLNVYDANDAYLSQKDPRKTNSMYDIAARTEIKRITLRFWTIAAATKLKLERMGFASDRLTLSHFAALYGLRDNMELTRQFAEWIEVERVGVEELRSRHKLWRTYIEQGGRFEDLEREPDEPGPSKPRRRRKPDEARVIRLLEIVLEWVENTHLGPEQRKKILAMLGELRGLLERMDT